MVTAGVAAAVLSAGVTEVKLEDMAETIALQNQHRQNKEVTRSHYVCWFQGEFPDG
jgi:hypothetical protein